MAAASRAAAAALAACVFSSFLAKSAAYVPPEQTLDGVAQIRMPFVVSLQAAVGDGHEHLCGGSIIDEQIVLSAAHCLNQYNNVRKLSVMVGDNHLSLGKGDRHQIVAMALHERYEPLMGYDIVLLRVEPPFVLDNKRLQKIDYNVTKPYKSGDDGYLIGWGRAKDGLELVSFIMYDRDKCRQRGFVYVTHTEICAFSYRGRGACDGDSGGPLVNMDFNLQVGILSYGRTPCQQRRLYVYTYLYTMVDWISKHVAELRSGV